MSEKGGHKKQEVYEFMDANIRFVALAKEVLMRLGLDPDVTPHDRPITVALPDDKSGNIYKIQKGYVGNPIGGIFVAFVLEHYKAGETAPLNRYMVAFNEDTGTATRIYPVNPSNGPIVPLDTEASKIRLNNAARDSLQILSSYAPEAAERLLQKQFDKAYDTAVGTYILSDYAIEGIDVNLDPEAAQAALQEFHEKIKKIGQSVIKNSRRRKSTNKRPQPAYSDAVAEAVESRREADGRNRYKLVEYGKVVMATARDIKKWKNKVSPID